MVFFETDQLPPDFDPAFTAAGAFLYREDQKFLLLFRSHGKPQEETWCVPGGKVNPGESEEDAIYREVHEETGLRLPGLFTALGKAFVRYPKMDEAAAYDFIYSLFDAQLPGDLPDIHLNGIEHSESRWVTARVGMRFNLIPGMKPCIERFALAKAA